MKLVEEKWRSGTAYDVLLAADTTPETLPTSGKDVEGMNDGHTFAPLSVLVVVDPAAEHRYYLADESGHFVGQ